VIERSGPGVVRRVCRLAHPRRVASGVHRRVLAVKASAADAASRLRWRVSVRAALRGRWRPTLTRGAVDPSALPVIVCMWRRPQRLDAIIEQLSAQRDCPPLRLIFWNNNRHDDRLYRDALRARDPRAAVASIEYRGSRINLGGIARFVVARQVVGTDAARPFVMLDDDQDIGEHFILDLMQQYRPRTYAGVWSFVTGEGYWDRVEATPSDEATYVGTGGSICDATLVADRRFFDHLPTRYRFVEDLWASFYARSLGWRLRKVDTPIVFTLEDQNQYRDMIWLKGEFHDRLTDSLRTGRPL
jgi:hypothetical protein